MTSPPHSSYRLQEVVQVERIIRADIRRRLVDVHANDNCVLEGAKNTHRIRISELYLNVKKYVRATRPSDATLAPC